MIKIRKEGERITVAFPYNPDYIAKINAIKGYKRHPEEKCWSLQTDNGILEKIASLFEGEKVDINPLLHLEGLRKELTSRKYSPKTINAYLHYNEAFLRFIDKNPEEVTNEERNKRLCAR